MLFSTDQENNVPSQSSECGRCVLLLQNQQKAVTYTYYVYKLKQPLKQTVMSFKMKQGKEFASLLWILHGYIFLLKLFFYKDYLWFFNGCHFSQIDQNLGREDNFYFLSFTRVSKHCRAGERGMMPMVSRCLMDFSHWFRLIIFHLACSFLWTSSPQGGSSGSHAPAVHQLCPTNLNPSLCSS